MKLTRPVDDRFSVSAHFMEWGERWHHLLDPNTGFWIPKGSKPGLLGQHRGIDFEMPAGGVVSAMADGMIVRARFESAIRHDSGDGLHILQIVFQLGIDAWWIKYSHLKAIYVEVGDKIKRGQPLAESGTTGNVKVPLLHVDLMDTRHQYHPIEWN